MAERTPTPEELERVATEARATLDAAEAMLKMQYGPGAAALHGAMVSTIAVIQTMNAAMANLPPKERKAAFLLLKMHTRVYLDYVVKAGSVSDMVQELVTAAATIAVRNIEAAREALFKE